MHGRGADFDLFFFAGVRPWPHGSTLDTKTKTGSTSSVTLTLIKTEYWDRAGGGGNISYDW